MTSTLPKESTTLRVVSRQEAVKRRTLADRLRVDPLHTVLTVSLDVAAATAAVLIGTLWREGTVAGFGLFPWLFVPAVVFALGAQSMYRRGLRRNWLDEVGPIQTSVALAVLFVLTVMVVVEVDYRPGALMSRIWVSAAVLMALVRLIRIVAERRARRRHGVAAPALVIGGGPVGNQLIARMQQFPEYGLNPIGILDSTPVSPDLSGGDHGVPYLGSPADLDAVLDATGAEELIVAFAAVPHEHLVAATRTAHKRGLRVWIVPRLFDTVGAKARVDHLGGMPLMVLPHVDPRGWQFAVKGFIDRVLTTVGLVLISPIFLLLALLVKLSSPGPIFFAQERIGRDGKPFDCLKFRSMRPPRASDAAFERSEGSAPGGVEGVDRRTRIGKLMRQTSLDELPQLINVIRGDMSLVGPRPERPQFVDLFEMQIRRYGERHRVKAGVTGWAQVHGLRGQTSIADRAEWDNYYIENWSVWLDVKILFLTVAAVLKRAED